MLLLIMEVWRLRAGDKFWGGGLVSSFVLLVCGMVVVHVAIFVHVVVPHTSVVRRAVETVGVAAAGFSLAAFSYWMLHAFYVFVLGRG